MQNRRNYYRLLQVQPDAAADVIKASYRTMMQKLRFHPDLGGDDRQAAIINEAYAVLSDPVRRARYDSAQRFARLGLGLNGRSRVTPRPPANPFASARRASAAFEALPCALCRTVNNVPVDLPEARRCRTCDSPLTRAQKATPTTPGARAVHRLERSLPVRFVRASAQDGGHQGLAKDLSSQGMRFVTRSNLADGELLRLECELLSAVARVVTCRRSPDNLQAVGVAFVTVEFHRRQGSLFTHEA